MKLNDKDAAFIAAFITADVLKSTYNMEPDGTKDGVNRYDTPVGAFFLPVKGNCRENKALDALYKIAVTLKKPILETAFEIVDNFSLMEYNESESYDE